MVKYVSGSKSVAVHIIRVKKVQKRSALLDQYAAIAKEKNPKAILNRFTVDGFDALEVSNEQVLYVDLDPKTGVSTFIVTGSDVTSNDLRKIAGSFNLKKISELTKE